MITDNKDCGHMVYQTHTTEGRLLGVMVPSVHQEITDLSHDLSAVEHHFVSLPKTVVGDAGLLL